MDSNHNKHENAQTKTSSNSSNEEDQQGAPESSEDAMQDADLSGGNFEGDEGSGNSSTRGKHHPIRWTVEQDARLISAVEQLGPRNWKSVAAMVGDGIPATECYQHWSRVLDPRIDKTRFTRPEWIQFTYLLKLYGHKWTSIAREMPRRKDTFMRSRWKEMLRARSGLLVQLRNDLDNVVVTPHDFLNRASCGFYDNLAVNHNESRVPPTLTRHLSLERVFSQPNSPITLQYHGNASANSGMSTGSQPSSAASSRPDSPARFRMSGAALNALVAQQALMSMEMMNMRNTNQQHDMSMLHGVAASRASSQNGNGTADASGQHPSIAPCSSSSSSSSSLHSDSSAFCSSSSSSSSSLSLSRSSFAPPNVQGPVAAPSHGHIPQFLSPSPSPHYDSNTNACCVIHSGGFPVSLAGSHPHPLQSPSAIPQIPQQHHSVPHATQWHPHAAHHHDRPLPPLQRAMSDSLLQYNPFNIMNHGHPLYAHFASARDSLMGHGAFPPSLLPPPSPASLHTAATTGGMGSESSVVLPASSGGSTFSSVDAPPPTRVPLSNSGDSSIESAPTPTGSSTMRFKGQLLQFDVDVDSFASELENSYAQ
eukprot:ANDGO_01461.mRNA.1 Myb-like protein N